MNHYDLAVYLIDTLLLQCTCPYVVERLCSGYDYLCDGTLDFLTSHWPDLFAFYEEDGIFRMLEKLRNYIRELVRRLGYSEPF